MVSYLGHATYRRILLLERLDPVTIVLGRCVLLEEGEFQGQVVSQSGIFVDLSKVEAVRNRERPKDVCEARFKFRGRNLFKEGRL